MFYSQFILAKKGPLGTIWIAAHLERKLRKNQVADTDIGVSVDSILFPDVPIALRLSSHLLLGVVRIYNRKVNYLFDDCSEALLKVKQAFRSTAVDLPPEESKAPYHSITLPETFDLDDFELPDNDILHGNYKDHHISSREQITLQDNMEGVSYSTSKFGLDERFGDGDALGLDLDEELFLEKIGTEGNANESADPQASVASMYTLKQDENTEQIPANSETMVDGVDEYDGAMDYTEGPCTPGLVEEPNLSNVKEASACDDHLESEYNLESTTKENSKYISSSVDKQEEVHSSSLDDTMLDALPQEMPVLETNDMTPHVECSLVEEPSSDKVEATNNDLESADNLIKPSDAAINEVNDSFVPVNEKHNHNQGSDELCYPSLVENFGSVENTRAGQKLAPDASEVTSDNQIGSFMGNPETEALDKNMDSSTLNLDAHDKEETTETPTLRACTTILERSDPSKSSCSVPVDAEPGNAALASSEIEDTVNIGKEDCEDQSQVQESVSVEAHHFASNEVIGQVTSTNTQEELVENLNKSVETELPAPEKLLSVPEGHNNLHKDMLDEFSPRVFVGHDEGDAGSKTIAGKKRTFTESTMTEQSLNSVESSRQVRGKRTVDSVPDDDDLLSSILVGRKSSVFKVKPTPRLSEVTSMKRTGSTQRSTAPKRKLVMDDTMVLHGDMIRQQLTSTEDIRRLRKKAPCTYSEISLIKKQHLEDQFFLEAVFTGMSVELASLHSQEYDLSRISVCQSKETGSSIEILSDPMLASLETNAPIETDPHLTSPMNENGPNLVPERVEVPDKIDDTEHGHFSAKDNELAEPIENPAFSENRVEEVDCTSTKVNISQEQIKGPEISQQEILLDGAEVGISSLNADAVNPAVIAKEESLGPIRNKSGDINENGESNYSANVDAPAVELDSGDVNDGQAIGRDGITEKDGNIINGECETQELAEGDIMMSDMNRDGGDVGPVPDAKNGALESDVLTDVYNVALEEQNMQVSELEDGFFRYGEDEAFQPEMNDAEFSGFGLHERDELNYSAAGNDTEFLNVDDDDLNEMADDHVPDDPEEMRITENSGWSSRTRAVSKYLQTTFVKEAECGRKSLSIDNLLAGKSRKEASRMFFETLVLKTRDYVHVEQWHPFDDITIKPRTKTDEVRLLNIMML